MSNWPNTMIHAKISITLELLYVTLRVKAVSLLSYRSTNKTDLVGVSELKAALERKITIKVVTR